MQWEAFVWPTTFGASRLTFFWFCLVCHSGRLQCASREVAPLPLDADVACWVWFERKTCNRTHLGQFLEAASAVRCCTDLELMFAPLGARRTLGPIPLWITNVHQGIAGRCRDAAQHSFIVQSCSTCRWFTVQFWCARQFPALCHICAFSA